MNEYEASNGVRVLRLEKGLGFANVSEEEIGTRTHGASRYGINQRKVDALREFFQHERDEELGRWRWPENPDYVVYPIDGDLCLVMHEPDAGPESWARSRAEIVRDDSSFRLAARAYFDAHPEPKPWHAAKPGEVWVVKEQGQPERAYLVDDSQFYDSSRGYALYFEDSVILEARRVWPEVS